jgi:iron complex transport system ATP-binding protein
MTLISRTISRTLSRTRTTLGFRRVRAATQDEVWLALAAPSTWPVALTVDGRYVALHQLDGIAERICARLGGPPLRVGQSTYVLGLAARVWGATLGPLVREGVLPDPAALVVRDDEGAISLGMSRYEGWRDVTPADLHRQVTGALQPVLDQLPLAPRLLWGNVASALHAAPRVLELPAARPWADAVLAMPPLAGEMLGGRRRTCCLFYEVHGGGLCSDCVLTRVPPRARR